MDRGNECSSVGATFRGAVKSSSPWHGQFTLKDDQHGRAGVVEPLCIVINV